MARWLAQDKKTEPWTAASIPSLTPNPIPNLFPNLAPGLTPSLVGTSGKRSCKNLIRIEEQKDDNESLKVENGSEKGWEK